MERFNNKPSIKEVLYALTSEATYPDWDIEILERADPKDVQKVREILEKGLPFNEAEIEVEDLAERIEGSSLLPSWLKARKKL